MVIIIFAGYENFVSKIDTKEHVDRPDWMGKVGIHITFFVSGIGFAVMDRLGSHAKGH